MTDKPLTLRTKDKKGYFPKTELISKFFLHTGNNKIYKVVSYVFHGDTDEWHILYKNDEGMYCSRTIENFFGKRGTVDRFIQINGTNWFMEDDR